jgi:hypothetical protein
MPREPASHANNGRRNRNIMIATGIFCVMTGTIILAPLGSFSLMIFARRGGMILRNSFQTDVLISKAVLMSGRKSPKKLAHARIRIGLAKADVALRAV